MSDYFLAIYGWSIASGPNVIGGYDSMPLYYKNADSLDQFLCKL